MNIMDDMDDLYFWVLMHESSVEELEEHKAELMACRDKSSQYIALMVQGRIDELLKERSGRRFSN